MLIMELPISISECAIWKNGAPTCVSPSTIDKISTVTKTSSPVETMKAAKEKTGCKTERCVLEKMVDVIGHNVVEHEIRTNLKVKGPTGSKLLSNINIDATLVQWAHAMPDFFAYNFNMRNYAQYSYHNGQTRHSPDTLATIEMADLVADVSKADTGIRSTDKKYYTRAACVINSDVYQGPGKHWMALFVDVPNNQLKNSSNTKPASVEFFNSSGNAPAPEWVNWMEKTRGQLENLGYTVKIVRASNIRHQKSKSECGLYSLFYIWSRLNGVPYSYFSTHTIPDKLMFEFRQHLFNDPSRAPIEGSFDWEKFRREVKIEWEPR